MRIFVGGGKLSLLTGSVRTAYVSDMTETCRVVDEAALRLAGARRCLLAFGAANDLLCEQSDGWVGRNIVCSRAAVAI